MGPTASGKTALSVEVAKALKTEIISVDSRQMYKRLDIGTAKPNLTERGGIIHHFIDNLDLEDTYSAADFAREAQSLITNLFKTHDYIIAVGGSTLYFKALLEGLDDIPPITVEIHEEANRFYQEKGLEALQERVALIDGNQYNESDKFNHRRLIRALEVYLQTGHPMSYYQTGKKTDLGYNTLKFGLFWDRKELYERIHIRCDEMLELCLLEEVKKFEAYQHHQAMQTVGYKEFISYFKSEIDYDHAVTLFKQHTRNYAKRQLTWFNRDTDIQWINLSNKENAKKIILDAING